LTLNFFFLYNSV